MSAKVAVPNPAGLIGDTVKVSNYRRQGRTERGTIERMDYRMAGREKGSWTYGILLARQSRAGNPLRITVGDEDIVGAFVAEAEHVAPPRRG